MLPPYGPPTPPPQRPAEAHYPRVIDQRPGPSGWVRVTFSLPGLRRLVATVPEATWLEGDHLPIGVHAGALLERIAGPAGPPPE